MVDLIASVVKIDCGVVLVEVLMSLEVSGSLLAEVKVVECTSVVALLLGLVLAESKVEINSRIFVERAYETGMGSLSTRKDKPIPRVRIMHGYVMYL